ncbi:hypothetical protein [Hyphomicrobium sp.]|uniref:hypothetical protein n=1 Tax=Hyphomicrobium sp. TaxID=82 RepID=UPI0025C15CCB|nr:hypothetical protein [Hyphomicrobium sp.]MCC7253769.1 hypothetical protein [Hyphomicrobium sp.]
MVRRYGWLFSLLGAPVVALLAALSYARSKTGLAAQISTFLLLVPVIIIVTLVWFLVWSFLIWAAVGLIAG